MIIPKVSICIPTYYQPELFRRTLNSIFEQNFFDYEIVITDDTSDESIKNVVNDFTDFNKIRYFKNKIKKGTPENWNESIRNARGQFIKIMHHDDFFSANDSLLKFVQMLESKPEASFAFSGCINLNLYGQVINVHSANIKQLNRLEKDLFYLFKGNFIGAPSTTIFKNNLNIYFDSKFKWVVDYDFYMRLLISNHRFNFTTECLVSICNEHAGQVSLECQNGKIQVCEYLDLYNKLMFNKKMKSYQFIHIWYLFESFEIRTINDLNNLGYKGNIPSQIHIIFKFTNNSLYKGLKLLFRKSKDICKRK
jgi:glycosyltransferase involved in cell wall biosynthesis